MPISQKQRELVEALKLSPYVCVTFEFGDRPILVKCEERLFSHDVGIALQGYYLRKQRKDENEKKPY